MEDNIRLCNHCYNTTSHQLIVDGDVNKFTHETKIGNEKVRIGEPFTYFFVKCETCGEYSLLGCFNDQLSNPKLADIPTLYPKPSKLDASVPQTIRKVYEKATQIKNTIPDAFAGQIRKAIEYLCKDKKAKGKNLALQLKSLVDMGILPAALNEMTTIIRELGNYGVHAKNEEVTLTDTNDLDDFFRFIIEYVYVAPAKIEQVKFNLDRRKLISEYGDLIYEIEEVLMDAGPRTFQELDYYHYGDSPLPYEYEEETVLIVKKLKDLSSKAKLLDYVREELGFSFSHPIQEDKFLDPVWDLWNEHKK